MTLHSFIATVTGKSRGCNGIALSHCLWLCKQAEVAMALHLVIASEFAAERASCGPERHGAWRGCRIRNQQPLYGSQFLSLLLSISVSLSLTTTTTTTAAAATTATSSSTTTRTTTTTTTTTTATINTATDADAALRLNTIFLTWWSKELNILVNYLNWDNLFDGYSVLIKGCWRILTRIN